MPQQSTFYPVVGGLDETSQTLAVPRGRVIGCRNHESVYQGYGRVSGHERFDGRPSPTAAYTAAEDSIEAAVIAREAARDAIGQVPGTGPVRGVWTLGDAVYAWRDNVAQTACVMFRATPSGWQPVNLGHTLGFTNGGPSFEIGVGETIVGQTSGAVGIVRKVVLVDGNWTAGTARGYLVIDPPTGLFVAEDLQVDATTGVATLAGGSIAQGFPPGGRYEFETHNFYASASMRAFYGVNGIGRGFEVDAAGVVTLIQTQPSSLLDVPTNVFVYKDHLFFGFANGSLVHSQPGEPVLFDGAMGATELSVGAAITGFGAAPGGGLFIFSDNKISALFGSNFEDWVIEVVTDEGGAHPGTIQRLTEVLYMDNVGVRSVNSAREYANFRVATITNTIATSLQRKRARGVTPVASVVIRDKAHYRLFFSDGSGISIFFGRKYPECMMFDWPSAAFCACSSKEELGDERAYVGSEDGFVYRLETGTSFDGQTIEAYLQFAFDHETLPMSLKKWHKVTFEMASQPNTQIGVAAEFDYSGVDQPGLGTTELDVVGGGGALWSVGHWDEFYWSSPLAGIAESWIDGQGFNMSLIVVSTSAEQMPYIVQGVTKSFTIRGTRR